MSGPLTPGELTILADVTLNAAEFAMGAARASRVPTADPVAVTAAMWRARAATLTILSGKLLDMSREG